MCVCVSHSIMSDSATPWNSPGKNTGVGSHSLLQGIFPTKGSNLGVLYCRQILYHLSYQGSPYISIHIRGNKIFFRKEEVTLQLNLYMFLESEPGAGHSGWSEFGVNKAKHVGSGTPGLLS